MIARARSQIHLEHPTQGQGRSICSARTRGRTFRTTNVYDAVTCGHCVKAVRDLRVLGAPVEPPDAKSEVGETQQP